MTETEPQPIFSAVRMEIDVSPTWWPKIHHRRGGAFSVTLSALIQILDRRKLEPLELRANEDRIVVVLAVGLDVEPGEYQSHAVQIRAALTLAVTIEPEDDFHMDLQFVEVGESEAARQSTTRRELEEVLRKCGFVQGASAALTAHKYKEIGDNDIWTLPTGSRCVQFDEDTTIDMVGTARWMDATGEKIYTFDTIVQNLAALLRKAEETNPVTPDEKSAAGILPGKGSVKGGIFA
jgi:hypothetical protein